LHQINEFSLDLRTWAPLLIAPAAYQRYDYKSNYALFNTFPTHDSLHSVLPLHKRHGGVATFTKDYGHAVSRVLP
jgi:hypothetical protein